MRFAVPALLWLLLAVPALGLAAWATAAARRRALARFAGGATLLPRVAGQVSAHRRAVRVLLLLVAVASGVVAAARPQWGTRLESVTRRGVDVVLVLDTSLSMAAADLAPSRLDRARFAAAELLDRLVGNRVGLVTFAGGATLACPLTLDAAAARLLLDTVDLESVPVPGSALAEALATAARALGPVDGSGRGRAVVLFTDGEDHEGRLDEASERLKEAGVVVYAVGTGTLGGGPIPLQDVSGTVRGYKKDGADRVVTTRLEEDALERLALATDGRYYRLTPTEIEIGEIADAILGMEARELGSVLRARYEERFQWPLALCLAALLAETVLGDRRTRRRGPGTTEAV